MCRKKGNNRACEIKGTTENFFRKLKFQNGIDKTGCGKKIFSIFFVLLLTVSGFLTIVVESNENSDVSKCETAKEIGSYVKNIADYNRNEEGKNLEFSDDDKFINSISTRSNNKDSDNDGLTDEQEEKYKTSPYMNDTDEDGLSDYDEIFKYNTCPYRESTDGDMYDDGMEILGHSPVGLGLLGGDMPGYVGYPGNSVFCAAYPEIDIVISDNISVETVQEITTSTKTIETNTWDYEVTTRDGSSINRGTEETHTFSEWQETHNSEYDREFAEDYRFQLAGPQNFIEGINLGLSVTTQQGTQLSFDISDSNPYTGQVKSTDLSEKQKEMVADKSTPMGGLTPELWEEYLKEFYTQEGPIKMSEYAWKMKERAKIEGTAIKIGCIVGATALAVAATVATGGTAAPIAIPAAIAVAKGAFEVGGEVASCFYSLSEDNWKEIYDYYKVNDYNIFYYNLNWKGWIVRGGAELADLLTLGPLGTPLKALAEKLSPIPLPWEFKLPRDYIVRESASTSYETPKFGADYEITMSSPGLLNDGSENGNFPFVSGSSSPGSICSWYPRRDQ